MKGDATVGSPTAPPEDAALPPEVGSEALARLIETIAEGSLDRERTR
jgi:hypothetical protein